MFVLLVNYFYQNKIIKSGWRRGREAGRKCEVQLNSPIIPTIMLTDSLKTADRYREYPWSGSETGHWINRMNIISYNLETNQKTSFYLKEKVKGGERRGKYQQRGILRYVVIIFILIVEWADGRKESWRKSISNKKVICFYFIVVFI